MLAYPELTLFSLNTGLRQRNVLDLKWQQLDLARKVAWYHSDEMKAGQALGVALNDTAMEVIRRQVGKHPIYVFVNKRKNPIQEINSRYWKESLLKAGIENFTWHDLRHTWASWLVQRGIPLRVLQGMGGWKTLSMVQRYAHLAPEHLHPHAQMLESVVTAVGTELAQCKNPAHILEPDSRGKEVEIANKNSVLLVPGAGIEPARGV
ncbi:site-specific integrase [Uruburuella testudinis]|uniref:Site-specific integrase n=1 Tax=Uruburuella testudinis TaxID=1282863 RepID=A0ABY4DQA7_9NEIS|nr:site-specific integrase [Uruburuella testudinis]UOO81245.1 site-specific integrase [Uruburuella testudinis]